MRGKSRLPDARRERAILALVRGDSREAAASAANVSERVLYRWLREPCFRDRYLSARDQFLRESVTELARLEAGACAGLYARIHGLASPALAGQAA
jgi:hypothetical protein